MSSQTPDNKPPGSKADTTSQATGQTIQIVVPPTETTIVKPAARPRVRNITYVYIITALIVVILLILSIFLIYVRPVNITTVPVVNTTPGAVPSSPPPPPTVNTNPTP